MLDRLIQQAVLQVLERCSSDLRRPRFGFRIGRSADRAVERVGQPGEDGAAWVVDVDLDAFCDRV